MKKRGFTLVEMIVVIVIMGILSAGTFVAIKHLYQRVAKSKALSELSFDSQVVSDQISALLYDRVPSTVIGYDVKNNQFESIYNINDNNYTILEWIGISSEALKARQYSGFVDLDKSDVDKTIASYGINDTELNTTICNKFDIDDYDYLHPNNNDLNATALMFAGSFDTGIENNISTSFGWHNNSHNLIYNITKIKDNNITLAIKPVEVYEKYYLVDSAYAIARGKDVNISTCNEFSTLNNYITDMNNTLFLFYNYRPWKGKTFCGDKNGVSNSRDGNVTILSKEAKGFEVGIINDSIYFNLTLSRHIRGVDTNVTISKQKVVF